MRSFRSCCSLLGLVILAFGTAAQAENCTLKQLASLDMVESEQDRLVVPATINGTKGKMLVDTGGIMSAIFSDAGQRLGLKPAGAMAHGGAIFDPKGDRMTQLVFVSQFGLGEMLGSDIWFLWKQRDEPASQEAGYVAPDILRKYDVDLDFASLKFKLFSPDHCEGRVVYWTTAYNVIPVRIRRGGHIEITVTLDGVPLRAMIDTGSPLTTISAGSANALFAIKQESAGVEREIAAKSDDPVQYRFRFKELSFGGVTAPKPWIGLYPDVMKNRMQLLADPPYRQWIDPPPMVIGLDMLRRLHVYIAYREQKIYLTAANAGTAVESSTTIAASKN